MTEICCGFHRLAAATGFAVVVIQWTIEHRMVFIFNYVAVWGIWSSRGVFGWVHLSVSLAKWWPDGNSLQIAELRWRGKMSRNGIRLPPRFTWDKKFSLLARTAFARFFWPNLGWSLHEFWPGFDRVKATESFQSLWIGSFNRCPRYLPLVLGFSSAKRFSVLLRFQ